MSVTFETKDSGEREQFDSGMVRDSSQGKTRYDLLVPTISELGTFKCMITRWAELLTRGAEKYEARNWEQASGSEEYNRFKESAFRHFMQWYLGHQDEDHAAAVFFNIEGAEYTR